MCGEGENSITPSFPAIFLLKNTTPVLFLSLLGKTFRYLGRPFSRWNLVIP